MTDIAEQIADAIQRTRETTGACTRSDLRCWGFTDAEIEAHAPNDAPDGLVWTSCCMCTNPDWCRSKMSCVGQESDARRAELESEARLAALHPRSAERILREQAAEIERLKEDKAALIAALAPFAKAAASWRPMRDDDKLFIWKPSPGAGIMVNDLRAAATALAKVSKP